MLLPHRVFACAKLGGLVASKSRGMPGQLDETGKCTRNEEMPVQLLLLTNTTNVSVPCLLRQQPTEYTHNNPRIPHQYYRKQPFRPDIRWQFRERTAQ